MSQWVRKTFPVPPLSCNCSILGDLQSKEAIVVDPGGSPERILEEVDTLGLTVIAIVHTHAHFDHFLASGTIKQATGAPLYLHPHDRDLWNILEIQCRMFGVPYVPAPSPDREIQDGEDLLLGQFSGVILHTPGHTPGSSSFYFEQPGILLSGDTLFRGGIGRTDLWGGDSQAIKRSIREKIYTLRESTVVVPGHGSESSVGWEREYNMFVTA
ncbi:MAG: MBL fold metallo-hydrolase [Nitrospirales bacterium]|nr:MBL fold metallo-hydrolase [Nitrospirales bacterium]